MTMRGLKVVAATGAILVGLVWAAVAAGAPAGLDYSGTTSQDGGKVSFTVSTDGTTINDFTALMRATCTKAGQPEEDYAVSLTPTSNMRVQDDGFGFSGGFHFSNGGTPVGYGNGALSGQIAANGSVSGVLRFPWKFNHDAGDFAGYSCDTGSVNFHAPLPPSAGGGGSQSGSGSHGSGGGGPTGAPGAACVVPKLKGKKLAKAKKSLKAANCQLGKVRMRSSKKVKARHVITQKPGAKAHLAAGAKVRLVVSTGAP